jgi:hypothetical protein
MTPQQFTRVFYRDRAYMEYTINKAGEPAPPKLKYAAEEWLGWPCRTKIRELTYAPGKPTITENNDFNIWQDTGVRPARGDVGPWENLVARMFKGMPEDQVIWFKRWLAYPLQKPGTKMYTCVLVWSHEGGTGKNLLAETMFPIYGETKCTVIKAKHLTSDFNGWAEGRQFVVGDEITLDDKRHTSGDLKSMLTSKTVRINHKGIESYEVPNCCNFYFTSNDPVAIMLDQGERRTFVHHVPETPIGDAYGVQYARWLASGGAAAVAWYLKEELSLGNFSPTAPPPDTMDKLDLIANSRSDIDSWAAALKMNPENALLSKYDAAKYTAGGRRSTYAVYTPEELLKLYDPEDKKRCSMRALGIALDRAGFRKALWNNVRLNNVRTTFWLIQDPKPDAPPITSAQAAEVYKSERPDVFQLPADKKTGKRKAN